MNLGQHEDPELTAAEKAAVREQTLNLKEDSEQKARETPAADDPLTPLFSAEAGNGFKNRWDDIQIGFVDEPRHAVEQADELVAQVMQSLAETFAEERGRLENQWRQGDHESTENLRVVLRRYRSFFHRLLSI